MDLPKFSAWCHAKRIAQISNGGQRGLNAGAAQRRWQLLVLAAATLICLLPFSGKAFHIDDPLFVWSAQQISRHPLDPYGFQVLWDRTLTPMSEVTKNPPLACYYAAAIGSVAGWSERALHLGFLLPALAMALGTYLLAERLSESPLVAASATLLTPGVMVSATSVMSDTLMLAFWVWAVLLWLKGLDSGKTETLCLSAVLMSAAALTKYFGICTVPLLLAYSIVKQRRLGRWAWYFILPIAVLIAYQLYTRSIYGHGMFGDALRFAPQRVMNWRSVPVFLVTSGSFVGGCTISALMLAGLLWSWRQILWVIALEGAFFATAWVALGPRLHTMRMGALFLQHWGATGATWAVCVGVGVSILALAAVDLRRNKDADSLLLALWVFGTFLFTGLLNWAINARTVLPLIPAAGILMARRMRSPGTVPWARVPVAFALLASGIFSFYVTGADAHLANSAKLAAELVYQRVGNEKGAVWFQGHWGFEYYMQQQGLRPFDFEKCTLRPGDLLIIPENAAETSPLPAEFAASSEELALPLRDPVITHDWRVGAGFYGSQFGPLAFVIGAVPSQRYELDRIATTVPPEQWGFVQSHQVLAQAK